MNPNAIVILVILWAGLCVAFPLWGRGVSLQGRIALPLLSLFTVWVGATLPLEPHGPGFALAAVLSFPLAWISHWLFPVPGQNTFAFAFVLIAGALSAAINFYLLAWAITATCRRLGGVRTHSCSWMLGAVLSGANCFLSFRNSSSVTNESKCLKCGAPLTPGTRDGVCPKCLLEQALASPHDR